MRTASTKRCLAASAALACAASIATSAPALAAQPLAGTTTFEASAPAMTRVTLPRDTVVDPTHLLSITGGGRAIVFVMRPAGAPVTDTRRVTSIAVNFCWSRGCKPDSPSTGTDVLNFGEDPGSATLPAGDYDIYVAPDGAPATVELKLVGLSGETTVRPSLPVQSHLEPASPTFAPLTSPGPFVYNASAASQVGAPGGVLYNVMAFTGTGPGDAEGGLCWYPDGSAPPVEGMYFKCPDSAFTPGEFSMAIEPAAYHHFASGSATVAGKWTTSAYLYGAAQSMEAHGFSLSLTYLSASASATRTRTTPRKTRARAFSRPRVTVATRRAR